MCNKCNKTIIEASEQDEIYIVKYIAKSLSKFTLIFTVYTSYLKTIFSAAALDASLQN